MAILNLLSYEINFAVFCNGVTCFQSLLDLPKEQQSNCEVCWFVGILDGRNVSAKGFTPRVGCLWQSFLKKLLYRSKRNIDWTIEGCRHFGLSRQFTSNCSYNYNQELHYPADPYQPSMIFFKPYWRSLPHLSALLCIS